jgi:CRISPR system Cascade subunit CasB
MTEKKRISFKDDAQTAILREWWKSLSKGSKAELRRCSSPEEVAVLGSFHELRFKLMPTSLSLNFERLALVAGLSAHVKQDNSSQSIGHQLAGNKQGSTAAVVSELRFRRLLAIGNVVSSLNDKVDVDFSANSLELYRTMIRIIHMLNGECNLASLANSVYWWNSKTKIELATEYFETSASQK